jgi:secondary thiamine-phosphate synthase enzyme
MKTLTKEIWMNIPQRRAIVSIHNEVERLVEQSGVQDGLVLINAMHITASVFINDDESGLHHDYEVWLEKLAPEKPYDQYHHNGYEDNADAHLKRTIMGREVVVAITDGKMHLGPWEHIFYYELDGRRKKRLLVKIIGE